MAIDEFDFVIVGAGSAGCVLAARLTEDPHTTVLVLEQGGSDRSLFIRMPAALAIPMRMDRYDWGYMTEPEPGLDGRRMACPRGKVIGGSSSINGLVHVRGNPLDFDGWNKAGAQGWAYRDVLPYFRRAETCAKGADDYRGGNGPLHTCAGRLANPLYRAFIEAGRQAGYPVTADPNGFQQEGFGPMDMTVHRGVRASAANAYLRPALARRNLVLATGSLVSRIVFAGRRAVGVRYRRSGQEHEARARREVILAGGPINSPQLLKLSGIGPVAELRAHGIAVVQDRPGVGENLQDHLEFYFQIACQRPVTLFPTQKPLARLMIGMRWMLFRNGPGATNHFESGGFIRSAAGIRYPDLQYHFLPLAVSYDGRKLVPEHGFQAHVGPMRSKSRGSVRLRSTKAEEKPAIRFNYMSHKDDRTEMRAAVRLTREVFAQPAFDPYRGREIAPGRAITSDDAIDAFIRQKAESADHPCGTCRMGSAEDRATVVDPEARVIGFDGLRIVDSSIMPAITTGNLNAPTIMIAEKMADHIRGLPPLTPIDLPFYVAPDWESRQR
ncbi:MAG: choline dehydrogenase [Acetobacteraceae bacterium]